MNGREVIRLVRAAGWEPDRSKGSHHVLHKDGALVVVPVHGAKDIAPGTLAAIQRQTGVKVK